MVHIIFETHDGKRIAIDKAPNGCTLMEAAREHDIPGIDAACGGCMACGTCHVVIDPEWNSKLPPVTAAERDILDGVLDPVPNSRLTCQIPFVEALEGIVLHIPMRQR